MMYSRCLRKKIEMARLQLHHKKWTKTHIDCLGVDRLERGCRLIALDSFGSAPERPLQTARKGSGRHTPLGVSVDVCATANSGLTAQGSKSKVRRARVLESSYVILSWKFLTS